MKWMISANSKMYNHASAFEKFGYIDWRQKAKYQIGDIVYIYCTRPYKKVMFKTEVKKIHMPFSDITDDKEFWNDITEYEKSQNWEFARLKLIEQVDTEKLCLEKLLLNGLKGAPQGPVKVNESLAQYINLYFNDYYSEGFFNDVEDETIFEGHMKSVKVNRYERSSIARNKCIEKHGCICAICNMNFEEVYGEVGKGFIHIHHIVPLNTICKEYKVDYEKDLIPVCPNCHSMLHRKINGRYLSIKELKELLNSEIKLNK
ncbi:HNH endonuclease [Clostridium sp.]|uniref:HNH endonuclease n=1 Tax=Clostridium sp. TaxID=1506 RepID=UPI00321733DE